jgi:cyclase
MKNLRIIPKLDIKNLNLVKGIGLEGLRVLGDPRLFINNYYLQGADEIIYHDVVASLYGRNQLSSLIKRTAEDCFIPIVVGGGIKNLNDIIEALNSGADRIFVNSAFIKNPEFVKESINYFGSSTIIASIEVLHNDDKFTCFADFGREDVKLSLLENIKFLQDNGVSELIITSIDSDGRGQGYNLKIAELISKHCKIPYILNGGFAKISHFEDIINCCQPSGIALGSLLHYQNKHIPNNMQEGNISFLKSKRKYLNFEKITIKEIKTFLKSKKINVNL